MNRAAFFGALLWLPILLFGQSEVLNDWHLIDPASGFQGVSVNKAYEILKGKKSTPIIVAVIDSGIDIKHEDLVGKIWVNKGEIAGNQADDDGNGYIDDVHGWNFIGSKDGTNIIYDTYEITREYARLKLKFELLRSAPEGQEEEYNYWLEIRQKYQNRSGEAMKQYAFYKDVRSNVLAMDEQVREFYQIPEITRSILDSLTAKKTEIQRAQAGLKNILRLFELDSMSQLSTSLDEALEHFEVQVKYGYNIQYNPREIIGDDFNDPYETEYGNSNVEGEFADHGTHVAGIIAANRNNDIGINGVAENVLIMVLRVVPNGDERDKDVANAIRYAANNGARIINMSFGKSFEYRRAIVDEAIDYASSKGVLFVQGAGNSNKDSDIVPNYPTPIRVVQDSIHLTNYITVGATGNTLNEDFVASFSNYGKRTVDLFAPGVQIYSTIPNNEYTHFDGTSMSSPVVAGVAALLWSYYPEFSASQIRDILMASVRKFDKLKVKQPGGAELVPFSSLSVSGGLIDASAALLLAEKRFKKLK